MTGWVCKKRRLLEYREQSTEYNCLAGCFLSPRIRSITRNILLNQYNQLIKTSVLLSKQYNVLIFSVNRLNRFHGYLRSIKNSKIRVITLIRKIRVDTRDTWRKNYQLKQISRLPAERFLFPRITSITRKILFLCNPLDLQMKKISD